MIGRRGRELGAIWKWFFAGTRRRGSLCGIDGVPAFLLVVCLRSPATAQSPPDVEPGPRPAVLPDDSGAPGADRNIEVLDEGENRRPPGPTLSPPLRLGYRVTCGASALLLDRPRGEFATNHRDLILLYESSRLGAINAETGVERWKIDMSEPPVWLGAREDLVILGTPYQVAAHAAQTGDRRWTFGERPARADSPAIDPEVLPRRRAVAMSDTLLVSVRDDGVGACVRLKDGEVLWERVLCDGTLGPIAMNDEWFAYLRYGDIGARLVVCDVVTGRELRAVEPTPPTVTSLRFSPQRTLLVAGNAGVAAFDPRTGERLWSWQGGPMNATTVIRMGLSDVCLADAEGRAVSLSLGSGCERWTWSPPEPEPMIDMWLDGDSTHVAAASAVYALDRPTGRPRWAAKLHGRSLPIAATLADAFIVLVAAPESRRAAEPLNAIFIERKSGAVTIEPLPSPHPPAPGASRPATAHVTPTAIVLREPGGLVGWLPGSKKASG